MDSQWGSNYEQSEQHAVFPGSVRTIGGVLQSPLLPGLYQMTYDYKDLDTNEEKAKTTYFVSLPLVYSSCGTLVVLYMRTGYMVTTDPASSLRDQVWPMAV